MKNMNSQKPSFIENQFPVSKISKESYKERKSNYSQTLTGLGKWWGRKPLILVRACIIGLLMPASDKPKKDREIFLKILTMDEEGLWKRKSKALTQKELFARCTPREREKWFSDDSTETKPKLKKKLSPEEKEAIQKAVFMRMSYDEKLEKCDRPEQIDGPSPEAWKEINAHLNTSASNIVNLVQELGKQRFGHIPRVGDAFCGGGSIPFEAARIGCEAYGSDLNPVAALLSWAALNIVGGGPKIAREVRKAQKEVYDAVDKQIIEWGIEHNEGGEREDAYQFCHEVKCPECGWLVPLAPSWVIGEKTKCVAILKPIKAQKKFEIQIVSGVSEIDQKKAKNSGTVQKSDLVCPNCENRTPIATIRGDRAGEMGKTISHLRLWTNSDLVPRINDVFQERLYCVRWTKRVIRINEQGIEIEELKRRYAAPENADFEREKKVLSLLQDRFDDWQKNGFIPSRKIEPGYNTDQPIRERGWTYWHHLFHPRQLLIKGLLSSQISKCSLEGKVGLLLGIGRCANWNSRLCIWDPNFTTEIGMQTFSNLSLNTLFNFGVRSFSALDTTLLKEFPELEFSTKKEIYPSDSRNITRTNDFWITDPPYADAVNYHEVSEFFLSWEEGQILKIFRKRSVTPARNGRSNFLS